MCVLDGEVDLTALGCQSFPNLGADDKNMATGASSTTPLLQDAQRPHHHHHHHRRRYSTSHPLYTAMQIPSEQKNSWQKRYKRIVRALKRGKPISPDTVPRHVQDPLQFKRKRASVLVISTRDMFASLPVVEVIPSITPRHGPPMSHDDMRNMLSRIKGLVRNGIYPQRLVLGSSGSYVCKDHEKPMAVFKPRDEEPYAPKNPKWKKRMQRVLIPCTFGRSCLVSNHGYASEASAALLSRRLGLDIVPMTEVVSLASPTFSYSKSERRHFEKWRRERHLAVNDAGEGVHTLPDKVGSLQQWVAEYMNATDFFVSYPYVDGPFDGDEDLDALDGETFQWTPFTRRQFHEQLERMIVLDYIMRNTDRSTDNWMVKVCKQDAIYQPSLNYTQHTPRMATSWHDALGHRTNELSEITSDEESLEDSISSHSVDFGFASVDFTTLLHRPSLKRSLTMPIRLTSSDAALPMAALEDNSIKAPKDRQADVDETEIENERSTLRESGIWHVHIQAIDNGLAFPFKHPDRFRSYPFGWLWLPNSLLSRPFSATLRSHMLPLLTSEIWWEGTLGGLRRRFGDISETEWKQMVQVMKGQAWNLIECLKNENEGPLDLCRRQAVLVVEDNVEAGYLSTSSDSSDASDEDERRLEGVQRKKRSSKTRIWRKFRVQLHQVRPWFLCC